MIECKICGMTMKRVGQHIRYKHGVSKEEYDNMTTEDLLTFVDREPLKPRGRDNEEECKICLTKYKFLGSHLSQYHGITDRSIYDNLSDTEIVNMRPKIDPDTVVCPVCGNRYKYLNNFHLSTHGYSSEREFHKDYPEYIGKTKSDEVRANVANHMRSINTDSTHQS